jgi:hypothetical protein
MRALELDFRSTRPASRWVGPLLLALAAGVLADVGLSYRAERERFAAKSSQLAKLEPRQRAEAALPAGSPEELALARDTVERLSLPWENLFTALESAASEQVTLLGIEPDPKAGTVVINGDGKDYLAALTYVLNLSRTETLRAVHLVRHEIRQHDAHSSVGFAVSAAWKGVRP